jgi:hypothetical protein
MKKSGEFRCDRLKECLEMERDKYLQLEHSNQLELQELMNQVELGEEAILESNRYQQLEQDNYLGLQELMNQVELREEAIHGVQQALVFNSLSTPTNWSSRSS